jgi:hypothetical protein
VRQEALRESASLRAHWFSQFMSESDKFEMVGKINLILSCGAMKFGHTHHPMANEWISTLNTYRDFASDRDSNDEFSSNGC